ncbi:MAG: antitoxin of toxin-antitoxin stability system [Candidatus Berkelbacteria bacterium Licking1014_85]|uniref:Antitoxin n=1 Tax=Candidatus Berkelbacteria bacterium Licking1014_85 TaxID=2017148 RepID=A0A554LHN5_9BACT|nr:MAG: antitoxin of toxin-antitoxin stability system [Candidatus Berkelbacteria bacterium Licking1014_85]
MANRTISISEGRTRLFKIADEVQKPNTYYTLTENGKPKIILISTDEYDSLVETADLVSDTGLLLKIKTAEKEIKNKQTVSWEELKYQLTN